METEDEKIQRLAKNKLRNINRNRRLWNVAEHEKWLLENERRRKRKRQRKAARRKKAALKRRKERFYRSYKITRFAGGWYIKKFNIILNKLKSKEADILKGNPLLKESAGNDQFLFILFELYYKKRFAEGRKGFYLNPFTDDITKLDVIKQNANEVNWKCSICEADIKSTIGNFNVENFLCPKCTETHSKGQFIDNRIVNSSLKFRKACMFLYKHHHKLYKKVVRKDHSADR